jgi:hypothetical protein
MGPVVSVANTGAGRGQAMPENAGGFRNSRSACRAIGAANTGPRSASLQLLAEAKETAAMTRLTPLEEAIAERGGHVGEARPPYLNRGHYPDAPGWRDPDTSRKAAKSMEPHLGRLQALVLAAISACPRTARELESDLDMRTQTVTARIRELVLLGKVEDSGLRRMTDSGRRAKVWREK